MKLIFNPLYMLMLALFMMVNNGQAQTPGNVSQEHSSEQSISLESGYQFVSSYLQPYNPDMMMIAEELISEENLDFVRNSDGEMLHKIGSEWINNIGDWQTAEGYLFKMNNMDELTITGDIIDPQTPINLGSGYSFVSFLPQEPLNAGEAFSGILDNMEFTRDSDGNMLQQIGGEWVNNIGDLVPGEAYLVLMNQADELVYPSSTACPDTFTDPRDGKQYTAVQIGDQCWMAENINIGTRIDGPVEMSDNETIEKYCYNDDESMCDEYGGLYQFGETVQYSPDTAAQGICPPGWHVPTDHEWKVLEGTVDSQHDVGDPIWDSTNWRGYDVGVKLKATSGWNGGGGTDDYGFNAKPSGARTFSGFYFYEGLRTYFRTSSTDEGNNGWRRYLHFASGQSSRFTFTNQWGQSVRCIKD
ncbi:MAG: hypothetical protein K9I94_11780 [Bacteroidales bacterium]|nr:hypothetical protein [Bacteroidales bacterium]